MMTQEEIDNMIAHFSVPDQPDVEVEQKPSQPANIEQADVSKGEISVVEPLQQIYANASPNNFNLDSEIETEKIADTSTTDLTEPVQPENSSATEATKDDTEESFEAINEKIKKTDVDRKQSNNKDSEPKPELTDKEIEEKNRLFFEEQRKKREEEKAKIKTADGLNNQQPPKPLKKPATKYSQEKISENPKKSKIDEWIDRQKLKQEKFKLKQRIKAEKAEKKQNHPSWFRRVARRLKKLPNDLINLISVNQFKVGIAVFIFLILFGFVFIGWGNSLIHRPWTELTTTQQSVVTYVGLDIRPDKDLGDWQKVYWSAIVSLFVGFLIYSKKAWVMEKCFESIKKPEEAEVKIVETEVFAEAAVENKSNDTQEAERSADPVKKQVVNEAQESQPSASPIPSDKPAEEDDDGNIFRRSLFIKKQAPSKIAEAIKHILQQDKK